MAETTSTTTIEGYEFGKTVLKYLKHAATTLLGVAVAALLAHLSSADNLRTLLGGSPWALLLATAMAGFFGSLLNWWQHRNDPPKVIKTLPSVPKG